MRTSRGLVHRDIKPANILIDSGGTAVRGRFWPGAPRRGFRHRCSRSPARRAYMSPEQESGEGHRVDGRSDVFSLGVVLYELLTGRRPFRSDSRSELLNEIIAADPRPPRQLDDAVPRELERICLKAMAQRASDRYSTAGDLAEDLRHFFEQDVTASPSRPALERPTGSASDLARSASSLGSAQWDG